MFRMSVFVVFLLGFSMKIAARPSIKECQITDLGRDYQGKLNVARGGLECQRWDSQTPHAHNFSEAEYFPDSSVEDAANYCRNPDDDVNGTWCFTTDPNVPRQQCNIPMCSDYPECRLTDEGTEYLGFQATSSSGAACLEWSGTDSPDEESNYCRNPDGRSTGPWCYIAGNTAESCHVPFCKPSASCKRTEAGIEYSGTVSWTVNGRVCQRWDTQYPHSHTFADDDFPDGSVTDAQNFCRNPDKKADGPWCYTTDPGTMWEYCQLPTCQDCKVTTVERNYFGALSTTKSGYTCQRWDSQSPHPHSFTDPDRFPDASVEAASNYCRNPDGKSEGPWCYTDDSTKKWEYCDISTCKEKPMEKPLVPLANHIVHIGIDGLKPDCIELAPGGAPNMMERLREESSYTLTNARSVLLTKSGPAWSTMLSGMSIERTGVLTNDWEAPWRGHDQPLSPVTGTSSALPNVFQTLKAQDATIRTASLYDWKWMTWLANKGYPGYVDKELDCQDGYAVCDVKIAEEGAKYLINMYKATEKSYTFVYFGEIDSLGHNTNWCSDEYNEGIKIVDDQVGQILDAIETAGKEDDTLVILSSDHGGLENNHGGQTDVEIHVPMFIKGPGIKSNYELTEPVGIIDMVPTAIRALGLEQSPWWDGSVMWEAFEDGLWDDGTTECDRENNAVNGAQESKIPRLSVFTVILVWILNQHLC